MEDGAVGVCYFLQVSLSLSLSVHRGRGELLLPPLFCSALGKSGCGLKRLTNISFTANGHNGEEL